MIQFYAPDILTDPRLPESDSAHVVRVLRMHAGDRLQVVDGKGNIYDCILADENNRHAAVTVVSATHVRPVWNNSITIAVAPTKNMDRMEWLVEKLVEVGVNRIVPLRCARSERKDIKTERLVKIAAAAMKQSLKASLPHIDDMMPLKQFLAEAAEGQRFVGYCDSQCERRLLAADYKPGADVRILIGPEGDFTADEIDAARSAGYVPVTMGDNRLRTETAALVGAVTIHVINQAKPL